MRKLFGALSVLLLASCLSFTQNTNPPSSPNNNDAATTSSQGRGPTTARPEDTAPRDHNNNWGWIGIIGLAGLAGLMGRRDRALTNRDLTNRDYDRDRRPDDVRRVA